MDTKLEKKERKDDDDDKREKKKREEDDDDREEGGAGKDGADDSSGSSTETGPRQRVGDLIGASPNTFGIEIEFGTHDSPLLSFTHVEPCFIVLTSACTCATHAHAHEWKLETDADMTLELVSPILCFASNSAANTFKLALMKELQRIVEKGCKLPACAQQIGVYLAAHAAEFGYLETPPSDHTETAWTVACHDATYAHFVGELNEYNWDDTTKTAEAFVLLSKKTVKDQATLGTYLGAVVVGKSKKHDGYPNSQLNAPMTLPVYVGYLAYVKEPKAWRRLIAMKHLLTPTARRQAISRNVGNTAVKVKAQAIDLTGRLWLKTWFWLVSIRELTQLGLSVLPSYKDVVEWRVNATAWKNKGGPPQKVTDPLDKQLAAFCKDPGTQGKGFWLKDDGGDKIAKQMLADLLYLTVQKLITGAFGELGEPAQLAYQQQVFGLVQQNRTNPPPGALAGIKKSGAIANIEFCDFHSSLKDLTPLWFKASLCEVYRCYWPKMQGITIVFETLEKAIQAVTESHLEKILSVNAAFLKEYVNSLKLGLQFEHPVPVMAVFLKQYEVGRRALLEAFTQCKKSDPYFFLAVPGVADMTSNPFLVRKGVPPWEGRWDTLKPPIGDMFLVEHRNH
jgi:hypothetical protein